MLYEYEKMVSIIIPVYNCEIYIKTAIESVQNQTYKYWELLLIDDGSTDNTKRVIGEFLSDERIKYYYKKNGGQGSARNLGLKKCCGKYIAFLDADDLWDPEKIDIQLETLRGKKVDLVFSMVRQIDEEGKDLKRSLGTGAGFIKGFKAIYLMASGNLTIPNMSVFTSHKCIEEVGYFREDEYIQNIEDYDLWFRMLQEGYRFYGIGTITGSYRVHKKQSTYGSRGSSLKLLKLLEEMAAKEPDSRYELYYRSLILKRLNSYYITNNRSRQKEEFCKKYYRECNMMKVTIIDNFLLTALRFDKFVRYKTLQIRRFRSLKKFVSKI